MHIQKIQKGFTLVEILIVISLIALIASIASPLVGRTIDRSQSVKCMANLRQIGLAVANYAIENDDKVPKIETDPANPIYEPEDEAKGMLETLEPYGVTSQLLRCPTDAKRDNYFASRGTSYEWRPFVDDENKTSPSIYVRNGARAVGPKRVRIAMDFENVHFNRRNYLFLDGHVKATYN